MKELLPPNNVEAEEGVLGSIIIDPEALIQVADFLQPDHFYRNNHRVIYSAMLHLYGRNEPADFITICEELERRNELENIGGAGALTSLVNCVPTSGNVEYYGRIVERCALKRRLIHAGGEIVASAYADEADEALENAERLIYQVSEDRSTSDFTTDSAIVTDYLRELLEMKQSQNNIIGVPTGFRDLDFLLGGMQKSDLLILAARPGMGKSSMMLSAAYHGVLKDNRNVGIVSLEMGKKQLIQRLISMDAHIDLSRLRNGRIDPDEWEAIVASSNRLSTNRLWIDDTAALSISAMRSKVRRLHAKQPLDLLIVDYLQLMRGETSDKRQSNREQEINEITQGLKAIAKELNIPVLALAQLSREVERRADKTPQLSDLRESGAIENHADVVMFIYREEYYKPETDRKGEADIIIAKHRQGETGEVALHFNAQYTQFANLELEYAQEEQ